jgi:hypothetical protein
MTATLIGYAQRELVRMHATSEYTLAVACRR